MIPHFIGIGAPKTGTTQPDVVIKNLYSFLGVDNTFVPSYLQKQNLSVRQGTSPKNNVLGKVHAFLYEKLVVHFYNPLCDLLGYETVAKFKEYIKFRQLMQLIFYQKGYPTMPFEVRKKLQTKFVDEVGQLSTFINRDLTYWIE